MMVDLKRAVMLLVSIAATAMLSACGVQHVGMSEQEVRSEWGSMLSMASEEVLAVRAWAPRAHVDETRDLDDIQAGLKAAMAKWESMPDEAEFRSGVLLIERAEESAKKRIALARMDKESDVATVEEKVREFSRKGAIARDRYVIAARTYNDLIGLQPSKVFATVMMKKPAVSFKDGKTLASGVTTAGMLESLGASRSR